jgi:hypothetical protein
MTSSGIEPATFRLVEYCLDQQRYWVPPIQTHPMIFIRLVHSPCITLHRIWLLNGNICRLCRCTVSPVCSFTVACRLSSSASGGWVMVTGPLAMCLTYVVQLHKTLGQQSSWHLGQVEQHSTSRSGTSCINVDFLYPNISCLVPIQTKREGKGNVISESSSPMKIPITEISGSHGYKVCTAVLL